MPFEDISRLSILVAMDVSTSGKTTVGAPSRRMPALGNRSRLGPTLKALSDLASRRRGPIAAHSRSQAFAPFYSLLPPGSGGGPRGISWPFVQDIFRRFKTFRPFLAA